MGCDCCTTANEAPRRAACPGCGHEGDSVTLTTLCHQLATPWRDAPTEQQHYFCGQPGCEVVYFSHDGIRYLEQALRHPVGQKSDAPQRTLCYCYDIRYSDLEDAARARQCRDFVVEETRHGRCACEQRNPSGRCCLRDFPKQEE